MFNKILLATDGSECSLHATETVINIAKSNLWAIVDIVYVIDISKAKSDMLQYWNLNGVGKQRKERIQPTVDLMKAAGINYTTHFLRGEPGPTLIKYANTENFDLVVVGSRVKNRLQELFHDSVSHKVAKKVNCPVMIVKARNSEQYENVNAFDPHLKQKQNI